MLASAAHVTGTMESDWTITNRASREMYDQGMKDMQEKNRKGPGNFLYGRISSRIAAEILKAAKGRSMVCWGCQRRVLTRRPGSRSAVKQRLLADRIEGYLLVALLADYRRCWMISKMCADQ